MNHIAIYALYPNVVTIDDTAGAFDKDGNQVTIDEFAINAWVNPEQYKYDRAAEYPPLTEQLDYIYHNGVEAWKTNMIQLVKDKYPKPTE